MVRAAGTLDQAVDAPSLKGLQPVIEGSATASELLIGHFDSSLLCQPYGPHPLPNAIGEERAGRLFDRPPTLAR
jgi:hypothetical protein